MASFADSYSRALSRMVGGLFGWLNDAECDQRMTADRALSYAPVWNCVSRISGAFMIMPLNLKRQVGRNIETQTAHQSYQLLRWRPNPLQTPAQWKRQMLCHFLLWGNARAYIRREGGLPVELIPLLPDRTVTLMLGGEKIHATHLNPDDRLSIWENIEKRPDHLFVMDDVDVWHVPGLGFDGINGKSLITLARQSWGIGIDAERHIAKQQKKGYSGGLMLEAPQHAFHKQKDAEEFLEAFKKQHEGSDNAGNIGMLRNGITAKVMAMSNADAQFIEQRRFQREDAALWFVLQGITGDNSGNSYASLEQKNLAYRIDCLAPISTAIEEECDVKLLTARERSQEFYHKFNDGALLRTEKSAAMAFVSQGITARVLSPNEGREMFDLNPYEGGDSYENPAVTPGSPGQSSGETDDEAGDDEEMTARQARVAHLIGVEAGKVEQAAKQATGKGKNFVAWLDDFYGEKWPAKLGGWLEEIGIGREAVVNHCEESKRLLLDVAGYSTAENLSINVSNCVSTWKARASAIVEA